MGKTLDRDARYEPVLRFEFQDQETRIFSAERMTYSGHGGRFYLESDNFEKLVNRPIPLLETDDYFELD